MKIIKQVDLGEYIINIEYDDGKGYLKISILDELEEEIENIEIINDSNEIDPRLN